MAPLRLPFGVPAKVWLAEVFGGASVWTGSSHFAVRGSALKHIVSTGSIHLTVLMIQSVNRKSAFYELFADVGIPVQQVLFCQLYFPDA